MFDSAMDNEVYVTISLETPQTIALILTHMIPDRAPNILIQFPKEKRNIIAQLIATMETVNQNTVNTLLSKIQTSLQDRLNKIILSGAQSRFLCSMSTKSFAKFYSDDDVRTLQHNNNMLLALTEMLPQPTIEPLAVPTEQSFSKWLDEEGFGQYNWLSQ